MIESVVNSVACAIVAGVCFAHMKALERGPDCQSVGVSILFVAAIAAGLEPWWPFIANTLEWLPDLEMPFRQSTLLAVGVALVALATTRGALRRVLSIHKAAAGAPSGPYVDAPELVAASSTAAELHQAKLVACAVLRQHGFTRAGVSDGPTGAELAPADQDLRAGGHP